MLLESDQISTEKSVLESIKIVQWKKQSKAYNFNELPKTAILSINSGLLTKTQRLFSKKLKGLSGHNYSIDKQYIYCCQFGIGAPSITTLMEELRHFGVENFIFLGYAGSLDTTNSDTIYIVENTFSTSGCTFLYGAKDTNAPNKNAWTTQMKKHLNLEKTICWSTDAPYRETPSLIHQFQKKGAKHIDMECSAVYAIANFYNLNALCLVATADSIYNLQWTPPKNMALIHKQMTTVIQKILKFNYDN